MVGFVELWLFSGTNSYDFWHAMFSFFLLQFTLSCLLSYFLPVHLSTRYTGGAGLKKTWSWLTENYQPTGTGNIKKKITIQKNSKEKTKTRKTASPISQEYIYIPIRPLDTWNCLSGQNSVFSIHIYFMIQFIK